MKYTIVIWTNVYNNEKYKKIVNLFKKIIINKIK